MTESRARRAGRPRRAGGVDRNRSLGRVSEETWTRIREAAARAGKPFSHWAVELMLREAGRQET